MAESSANAARHGHQERSNSVASLPYGSKTSATHMADCQVAQKVRKAFNGFETHTGSTVMKPKKLEPSAAQKAYSF